jgi:hypothetical protein
MRSASQMRIGPLSLLVLGLAACRPESAQEAPLEGDSTANATGEPLPEADINASLESIVGNDNGAGNDGPRFVGRWAVEERICDRTAWRFTDNELRTPAGSVCRFTEVREVAGGYDIAARCTAEAPERDDLLKLRFPESAGGMLFESDSIADAGLVRCED